MLDAGDTAFHLRRGLPASSPDITHEMTHNEPCTNHTVMHDCVKHTRANTHDGNGGSPNDFHSHDSNGGSPNDLQLLVLSIKGVPFVYARQRAQNVE